MPVTFPPGRARLATTPLETGSVSRSMATIGIVVVSFRPTARLLGPPNSRHSGGRRTRSRRSGGGFPNGPGRRQSMVTDRKSVVEGKVVERGGQWHEWREYNVHGL